MTGAAQYLATLDRVTGKRIGAVGLRLAGGLAIWAAAASPLIGAAVTYYVMPHGKPDFAKIDGAVLGHFGTTDELVSADHIAMLEAELRGAGIDFAFELYEGRTFLLQRHRPSPHLRPRRGDEIVGSHARVPARAARRVASEPGGDDGAVASAAAARGIPAHADLIQSPG